jgi:hypothetical protein
MMTENDIFKMYISPQDIFLKKKIFGPFMWAVYGFLILSVFPFLGILLMGIFKRITVLSIFGGISCFCVLSIISAMIIKWNYYSKYPSTVEISQGSISVRFRRLFHADDIINITSQDQPFLNVDFSSKLDWYRILDSCQVTLHSMNARPIIIYYRFYNTKEEAIQRSTQFAELVVSKVGRILVGKIFVHT